MMVASHNRTKRAFGKAFLAAGVVAAAWSGFAPAAEAEHRQHRRVAHHRKIRTREHHVFVPRSIRTEDRAIYGRFYAGRVYYAPHRHYHASYRFPVYVNGAVSYRPYFYCRDHVFLSGSVALPRLAIGFSLGPVGGYYVDHGYEPYDGYVGCDRYGYHEQEHEYDDDDGEYEYEYEYDD